MANQIDPNKTLNLAVHRPSNTIVKVQSFYEGGDGALRVRCKLPDDTEQAFEARDIEWAVRPATDDELPLDQRWTKLLADFNAMHERNLSEVESVLEMWRSGHISSQEASDKIVWAMTPYITARG